MYAIGPLESLLDVGCPYCDTMSYHRTMFMLSIMSRHRSKDASLASKRRRLCRHPDTTMRRTTLLILLTLTFAASASAEDLLGVHGFIKVSTWMRLVFEDIDILGSRWEWPCPVQRTAMLNSHK